MSEVQKHEKSVIATGSKVWQVLGILLGTATCISIVKNGFAIELYGLPAAIFRQYAWTRDTLFWPVTELLRYFELTIPWWMKDAVVTYGLVAGAHWRAFRMVPEVPGQFGVLPGVGRVIAAALWPLTQVALWLARVERIARWYIRKTSWRRKIVSWFSELLRYLGFDSGEQEIEDGQVKSMASAASVALRTIAWELVVVAIGATAFFFWNHLQNVFGPGG